MGDHAPCCTGREIEIHVEKRMRVCVCVCHTRLRLGVVQILLLCAENRTYSVIESVFLGERPQSIVCPQQLKG